jgi:hypothetical protein
MKKATNPQKLLAALHVVAKKKIRRLHTLGAILSLMTTLGMTTQSAHADGSKTGSWNWSVSSTDFYSNGWTGGTAPNNQKPSGLRTWSGTNTSFDGQGGWFEASWTAANGNWIPDIGRSGGASGPLSTMVPNYTINWTGNGNITSPTGSNYTFGLKFNLGVRNGWHDYNKVDSYECYIVTHTNKTLAQQQAVGKPIGTVTPPGETMAYNCYLADTGSFYQLWAFRKVNSWSGPVNVHAILKHWAEKSGTPFNMKTWRAWSGFTIAAETFDTAGNFRLENIQIPNLDASVPNTPLPLTALLAYDGFNIGGPNGYTTGSLLGQDPKTLGFTGPWSSFAFGNNGAPEGTAVVESASGLTYSGATSDNTGGVATSSGPHAGVRTSRVLTKPFTAATAGTFYFSFRTQVANTNKKGYAGLEMHNGGTQDSERTLQAGYNQDVAPFTKNINTYGIRVNNDQIASSDVTPVVNKTALFVIKFTLSATDASDSVTLWVNPSNLSSEAASGAGTTISGVNFLADRVTFGNFDQGDGGAGKFDELRMGTTFQDVTSTPIGK